MEIDEIRRTVPWRYRFAFGTFIGVSMVVSVAGMFFGANLAHPFTSMVDRVESSGNVQIDEIRKARYRLLQERRRLIEYIERGEVELVKRTEKNAAEARERAIARTRGD